MGRPVKAGETIQHDMVTKEAMRPPRKCSLLEGGTQSKSISHKGDA